MTIILSILTPLFLGLACIGYGSVLMRAFRAGTDDRGAAENISLGFILGAGFWG